jgi:phosphoenolpyruvate carboxykinase (GTP)
MLPFCGYHMGDYFAHWLSMPERTDQTKLPRIYGVNWFRKDADGKFLWPGYSENSRVLEWICRRLEDEADAADTAIGAVPRPEDLVLDGLSDLDRSRVTEALRVDADEWRRELPTIRASFDTYGDKLPRSLREELTALDRRLADS